MFYQVEAPAVIRDYLSTSVSRDLPPKYEEIEDLPPEYDEATMARPNIQQEPQNQDICQSTNRN